MIEWRYVDVTRGSGEAGGVGQMPRLMLTKDYPTTATTVGGIPAG